MRIKLSQDDINNGKRPAQSVSPQPINLAADCPLALCLTRTVGKRVEVDILDDCAMAFYQVGGTWKQFDLPKSCKTFVERWDNHKTVDPFSFNAEV